MRDKNGRYIKGHTQVGPNKGKKASEETRKKQSEAKKKVNNFSYIMNEHGQLSHIVVDIFNRKGEHSVMELSLDHEHLLYDGGIHKDSNGYARQNVLQENGKRKSVIFHRRVLVTKKEVDHVDKNKLNNRIENLRPASRRLQMQNKERKNLLGAYFCNDCERKKPWMARVQHKGKIIFRKRFATELEAHEAYIAKCKEIEHEDVVNHWLMK